MTVDDVIVIAPKIAKAPFPPALESVGYMVYDGVVMHNSNYTDRMCECTEHIPVERIIKHERTN